MHSTRHLFITAIMALALSPAMAAGPQSRAQAFLDSAMKGDNAEIMLGKLAVERGKAAAVRSYGKMLAEDHETHRQRLEALGVALGVAKTDDPTPEGRAAHGRLSAMAGDAFDKAFAMHMVSDHRKDIARYETEARTADNPQVKALAQDTLPTLRRHLEAAEALAK